MDTYSLHIQAGVEQEEDQQTGHREESMESDVCSSLLTSEAVNEHHPAGVDR
jgi:hypothetical protein